jgi:hypothetical protein
VQWEGDILDSSQEGGREGNTGANVTTCKLTKNKNWRKILSFVILNIRGHG